ncbi:MAG TPA: hypothetical protein VE568_06730 [Rubrobacter sp.]|nr:hypothetical protein [Rubrobacter sp.]
MRDVEFRDLNAYVKKVGGSAFTSKYSCAWVGAPDSGSAAR